LAELAGHNSRPGNPIISALSPSTPIHAARSDTVVHNPALPVCNSGNGLTAMVIDDVLSIRKLMTRVLLNLGFSSVDCHENGLRGLEAMKAKEVDIVFTDIQMPILTGPEMASRFRRFEEQALKNGSRTKKQVIVAITANRSEELAPGFDVFDLICSKPINIGDIDNITQSYCKNDRA